MSKKTTTKRGKKSNPPTASTAELVNELEAFLTSRNIHTAVIAVAAGDKNLGVFFHGQGTSVVRAVRCITHDLTEQIMAAEDNEALAELLTYNPAVLDRTIIAAKQQ